ncbi:MAG: hypothetical protein P8100_11185 [bacterium]
MDSVSLFILVFWISGCSPPPETVPEPWVSLPADEWPDFALTNEVSFTDTTFHNLANAFLVNTGTDTLGVSCKHLFMVFEHPPSITSIDLGPDFKYWTMYPRNEPGKTVRVIRLINTNPDEPIGYFNTLKDRDWIILEVVKKDTLPYPLKIRLKPLEKYEVVYGVGWGSNPTDSLRPEITTMQCYKAMGNYYYMKVLSKKSHPAGKSGSPVIDKNGYLVGIASGAEGKLAVIGSVQYLTRLFDQYHISYVKDY